MSLEKFRCQQRLRVRWAEVDAQKIVFNAHYMIYMEEGIQRYWKETQTTKQQRHSQTEKLLVQKANITYQAPAKANDTLDIGIKCTQIDESSLKFEGHMYCGQQLLNITQIVFTLTDTHGAPQALPHPLRNTIATFEADENMTYLESGSWNDLGRAAEKLRTEVFVQEQKVPREMEIDALDPIARHIVIFNRLDLPIATARLVSDAPGVARIGRMAVVPELRGSKLGNQMLEALLNTARQRGDHQAVLNAQCHAQNFYAKAGFIPEGQVFDEAGIAHIRMRKIL